jgi:hypothetical protein
MSKDFEHTSKLIEAYFNNTMTDKEQEEFDQMLANNPEAKAKFEDERAMRSLLVEADLIDIRKQMQADMPLAKANKGVRQYFIWGTFVLAGIVGFVMLQDDSVTETTSQKQNEKIVVASVVEQGKEEEKEIVSENKTRIVIHKESITEKENQLQTEEIFIEETASNNTSNEVVENISDDEGKAIITKGESDEKIVETQVPVEQTTIDVQEAEVFTCDQFNPSVSVKTQKTSYDVDNGEIQIQTKEHNLEFAIENDEFQRSTSFTELSEGEYSVMVKDTNNCEKVIGSYTVERSLCKTEYETQWFIENDAEWVVPTVDDSNAKVEIFNKQRKVLFRAQGSQAGDVIWDGTSMNGQTLERGVYKAVITYDSGESCIVSVTLIR